LLLGLISSAHVLLFVSLVFILSHCLQAISDVKKFLEQHGVVAEALAGQRGEPSQDTFLVKNVPQGTTGDQLEQL
jgi:hypothetical protein